MSENIDPKPTTADTGQLIPETMVRDNEIFNVEIDNYFISEKYGNLRIYQDGEFDYGDFEEDIYLLGDEYNESPYEGVTEQDMAIEEVKENIGTEMQYNTDVSPDDSSKDPSTWAKNGLVVTGSAVPVEYANPPLNNIAFSLGESIISKYLPVVNQINTSYGVKLLATIMANKEGFYPNSRSYITNNPGNIGNTDSGANKTNKTLKDGILLQVDYITKVANGQHSSYPLSKRKYMPPYYSPEIAKNQKTYVITPFLPGYDFIYTGKLEQYVKIYATGARVGNSYLSIIITWFHRNGYTWVNSETTIKEIINIDKPGAKIT